MPNGFSEKRSHEIFEAACELSRWFKSSGIAKPDEFMALMGLIVIAEDQALTPEEIERGQQIARERGWLRDEH